jgi:hypothetical protein
MKNDNSVDILIWVLGGITLALFVVGMVGLVFRLW